MPETSCIHILCVKDDHKACITCGATLGCAYTADRMVDDVKLILSTVLTDHADAKAKFMVETGQDLSAAIRANAYHVLVLHHRAAYVAQLEKALSEAESLEAQREVVAGELKRLSAQMNRVSVSEWDSSAGPFVKEDGKARVAADAESLKTLEAVLGKFDRYDADHALPRIK